MVPIICTVYKSSKDDERYLYVPLNKDLNSLPEPLLALFPGPKVVTQLKLTADRQLARVDTEKVINGLKTEGFYLQLPPVKDPLMAEVSARNEKLPRA